MLSSHNKVRLHLDKANSILSVKFKPDTERTLYDVCDLQGRILKTGEITSADTKVDLKGLDLNQYILLVLDGNRAYTTKISLSS
jgi:hypothetical protein